MTATGATEPTFPALGLYGSGSLLCGGSYTPKEWMVPVREELPADISMKEIASGPHCILTEAWIAYFTKSGRDSP